MKVALRVLALERGARVNRALLAAWQAAPVGVVVKLLEGLRGACGPDKHAPTAGRCMGSVRLRRHHGSNPSCRRAVDVVVKRGGKYS